MGQDVTIRIKSTQTDTAGEQSVIEFFTLGRYYKKNDTYYLMYEESEISGLEGSTTTLKVRPRDVTLIRMGKAAMQHRFREGQRHEGVYRTPFGEMNVGIHPYKVGVNLGENGGELELDYDLELEGSPVTRNHLIIYVTSKGQKQ